MPVFDFDDFQMPDDNNHFRRPHSTNIVKVIGVGGCGCNIVEYICKIGIPYNNVDFTLIDHDPNFLNAKKSVDKKFLVDKDEIHLDGKLRNIIGEHCGMIVIVTGVGGWYSASVVASLCRLFQPDPDKPDTENNVSLALSVFPFDIEYYRKPKASDDAALISKYATKVITIDNEKQCDFFGGSVQSSFYKVDECVYDIVETICQMTGKGESFMSTIAACDKLMESKKEPSLKEMLINAEVTKHENSELEENLFSFFETIKTENDIREFNEQIGKRRKEGNNSQSLIKVVGVGSCGCNIVNGFSIVLDQQIPDADLVIIDNDRHSLKEKNVSDKHFIEKDDPALEDKIREILKGFRGVLFVVAGMGGEYSAPIVTELCRQLQSGENVGYNSVSIAISVLPFDFEKRGEKADEDIAMIAKEATKVITVDNEPKYKHIPDWPILLTMNHVGQYISDLIYAIMSIILKYDYNPVNYIDFATALKSGSKAVVATGRGKGVDRATKATGNLLLNFASMGYREFGDMKNLLLYISVSQEHHLTFQEFYDITQMMCRLFSQDANILWNASEDRYRGDEIALTAIAIF